LAGKLSLKKRDNESIFEKQGEEIQKNADYILNLRAHIKNLRQDLSKAINTDHEVIEEALSDRRSTQLECKRYDAQTAQKELNEDVCVVKKRLNHFKHQKECRARRLKDLQLQYRDFKLLDHSNFEVDDQRSVRLLSTKLDKMTLKRNTASFINRTYHKTLSNLNRDSLTMPKQIDELEKSVGVNSAELKDLEEIYAVAQSGHEASRAKRMAIEREFYSGKYQRDKILNEKKKIVKANADIPDVEVKPSVPVQPRKTALVKKPEKPSVLLSKLNPVIEMFSSVTNTKTAAEIPEAYHRQIENQKNLEELREKIEEKLEISRKKHSELKKRLVEAQFTEKQKSIKADEDIKSLNDSIETIQLENIRNSSESRNVACVISSVQEGLTCLAEKMNNIPNLEQVKSVNGLSNNEKFELIVKNIKAMQQRIDNDSLGTASSYNSLGEDPIEFLLSNGPNGCRIKIEDPDADSQADFLIDDAIMNESYRSYEEVKKGMVKKITRRKR